MIRELLGGSRINFDIKDQETLYEILKRLCDSFPGLAEHIFSGNKIATNILFARNKNEIPKNELYAFTLDNNDELAIIPPAGGGSLIPGEMMLPKDVNL